MVTHGWMMDLRRFGNGTIPESVNIYVRPLNSGIVGCIRLMVEWCTMGKIDLEVG